MIKLVLSEKPKELTIDVQNKLIKEFIDSDNSKVVWKSAYIQDAVKKLAFGKCCFSEIKLDTKSTYTEIEHFYPKDLYPNQVVEWGNLLPSSKKCNTTKGKTDTYNEIIVNPFVIDPKEHLYFQNFRLYPKDNSQIGKNTIEIVALNDRLHFVNPRAEETLRVLDLVDDFYHLHIANNDLISLSDRKKTIRIDRIKGYFCSINRKTEFSACIATAVKDSINYIEIIAYLKVNSFWDDEFQSYEDEINFCYLGK
jgi:uncharacterized protein (TIGR02646 family)